MSKVACLGASLIASGTLACMSPTAPPAAPVAPAPEQTAGAPSDVRTSASSTTSATDAGLAAPTPGVVVLDLGDAPRQTLAYRVKVGARSMNVLRIKTTTTVEKTAPDTATFELKIATEIEAVRANGDIVQKFRTSSVRILDERGKEPAARAKLTAQLPAVTGKVIVDPHAASAEVALDASAKEDTIGGVLQREIERLASDAVRHAWVPLPSVPVGAGARWRVDEVIARTGKATTQTRTSYSLTAVRNDMLTLVADIRESAPAQSVEGEFGDVNVRSLDGSGASTARIRLDATSVERRFRGHGMLVMDSGTLETTTESTFVPATDTR